MAKITQLKKGNENVYPLVHMDGVVDDNGNSISTMWDTKQETLVSGSNIKTVNGTSLLGSGDLAVVSVDAGNISVLQSTGDSQVDVMSQKAVSDYTRKVTTEDLAGTSDWIKAKLTDDGWEFGKYMKNTGSLGSDANYCVTPFIELGNRVGHSLTFRYMYDAWATGYFGCFTSGKVVIGATVIATNINNSRNITLSRDDAYYARMTCNPNKISQCYIYDNTTGEYIWKGEDCIFNANNDNRIVDYTTFETSMLTQEIGNDKTVAASQYALKSLDLHPATMFVGTLANYKISNFPILNPCQCDKLSFLIDRRYPSTSWFGVTNDSLVTTDFFKFSKDSSNYFVMGMSGYQWTIKIYSGGTAKVNQIISTSDTNPNKCEHVVCCVDFKAATANLYLNGILARENVSLSSENLTPYINNLDIVSVMRAEKWGSMGAAIFNDFLTASEVSAIYNSGTYVDWLIRDEYISKSFSADVLPMNALLSTGDGTRSNATETSVDIACTGSNSNAYQRMTIPSYVETKVCEMRLHISMTTGSITFKGFGVNGRWTANITNSSDGTTASSTLTAGNEYDIVARKQAPAGTSGDYFINYSRSADCSFTLSSCTLKQIGAPLICAPQNYNKVSFVQESGDAVPTSCTALYSPYKPKVVNSTGKNPQFTGQIAINPSTMAIYIGVDKTWKQINNS